MVVNGLKQISHGYSVELSFELNRVDELKPAY